MGQHSVPKTHRVKQEPGAVSKSRMPTHDDSEQWWSGPDASEVGHARRRTRSVALRIVVGDSMLPVPGVRVRGVRETGEFVLPEDDRGRPLVEGRDLEAWAQHPLVVRARGIEKLSIPYSRWDGQSPVLTIKASPKGDVVRFAGVVESESGVRLANAVVSPRRSGLYLRTDEDGRFTVVYPASVLGSSIPFRFWAPGHFGLAREFMVADNTEHARIVLTENTLQVEGVVLRVRTGDGRAAGGRVDLLAGLDGPPTGPRQMRAAEIVELLTGFSVMSGHTLDRNGELRIPLIALGRCRVRVVAGPDIVDTVVVVERDGQTIELRAHPGIAVRTEVDLDGINGGRNAISVRVEQPKGGSGWPRPTAEWARDGVLLVSGLPRWRHTLVLEAKSVAPVRIPVEADLLEPGRPSVVPPVSFYPRRTVTGVALDLSGERIQRGRITVRTKEGDYSRAWIREGRFEIEIAGTQVKYVGLRDSESRSTRTGISLTPITSREWRVRMRKAPVDLAEEEPNK